jgi:hypothetical protein
MKRLRIHVSVDNMADSVRLYSAMCAVPPSVLKVDYAKWMLDNPRVNFALSQRGEQAGLNHLGIQVESTDELGEMQSRLQALRPDLEKEEEVACCYAKSDKYWVSDPQGIVWETFHTFDNSPVFGEHHTPAAKSGCCIPLAKAGPTGASPCCVPTPYKQASAGACC